MRILSIVCMIRGGHDWNGARARERVGTGRERVLVVGKRCKICGALGSKNPPEVAAKKVVLID